MPLDNYIQSTELNSIKNQLLDNQKPLECSFCWSQEAKGLISKRIRDNKSYKKIFDHLNKDPLLPTNKFFEYYIRLGNHCNIRCTICNDTCSTGWISELKKYGDKHLEPTLINEDHEIWQHIKDNAAYTGAIEFIGGEPFMMMLDTQAELLNSLIKSNHAKHITLKYNSNGTKIPYNLIDLWKNFKRIELNISVDGVREKFEYLRYPAIWEEVVENINFYKNLNFSNLDITFMHTLSIFNIGYVNDIIEFSKDLSINVFFNMLEYPKEFNLFNFNKNVDLWIIKQLDNIDVERITNIKQNLIDKSYEKTYEKEFLNRCLLLDNRRNLNIEMTFPELINAINK
jgi:MoaA/NifB/PqqE/SkfB family radical SAM enzyme